MNDRPAPSQRQQKRNPGLRPDSTEERILAAATEQLRRVGLERMRVVAIADDLGISHAGIYRYFPSKEALADAVISLWLKEIERAVLEAANAPDPATDKLERMLFSSQAVTGPS